MRAASLVIYLDVQARLDLVVERVQIVRRDVQEDTIIARTQEAVMTRHSGNVRAVTQSEHHYESAEARSRRDDADHRLRLVLTVHWHPAQRPLYCTRSPLFTCTLFA